MMRKLFIALLALVLAAAPAAQAYACTCVKSEAPEDGARSCCCGDAATCDCCPRPERRERNTLDQGCACNHQQPRASETSVVDLPAPAPADELEVVRAVSRGHDGVRMAPVLRTDPHPEIVLPLLV